MKTDRFSIEDKYFDAWSYNASEEIIILYPKDNSNSENLNNTNINQNTINGIINHFKKEFPNTRVPEKFEVLKV